VHRNLLRRNLLRRNALRAPALTFADGHCGVDSMLGAPTRASPSST